MKHTRIAKVASASEQPVEKTHVGGNSMVGRGIKKP